MVVRDDAGCARVGAHWDDGSGAGGPIGTRGHRGGAPPHCWQPPAQGSSHYVPGQVLVRFKPTPSAARTAAAQARSAVLPGLRLHRLVGRHHALLLPHQLVEAGGAASRRKLAQAEQDVPDLPSGALMLYDITDGSTVRDMVARLCRHTGAARGNLLACLPDCFASLHAPPHARQACLHATAAPPVLPFLAGQRRRR